MFTRKLLIYDTECNSLLTEEGFIQELAWAVYDVETWRCLKSCGSLVRWNTFYEVSPGAVAATGLTRDFCEEHGEFANRLFTNFLFDVEECDFIAGHNIIPYDNKMLATNVKRALLYPLSDSSFKDKIIIDTMMDCPYPSNQKQMALKYLALDHGYILSDAHQGISDVFACKAILQKYNFNTVLEIAKTPIITLTVKTNWEDKALVDNLKAAKFFWNKPIKRHQRSIREFHLSEVQSILGPNILIERNWEDEKQRNAANAVRSNQQCFRGMDREENNHPVKS